jgi:hypothetical protein
MLKRDENITNMDTPTKVKLFFSINIFNTCDEWTLHHDMCSMSFTEVLTWIKEGVDHVQVLPTLPLGLMRSWIHQVQTFECPHGLHLSQLGEDMTLLQLGR